MSPIRTRFLAIVVFCLTFACEEGKPPTREKTFEPLPPTEAIPDHVSCPEETEFLENSVPRRLSVVEYGNMISDVFGLNVHDFVTFPDDEETMGFDNNGRALQASPVHIERYFEAAETIARRATRMVVPELECDLAGIDGGCLSEWIEGLGQRLWRRPLTAEEIQRFEGLFQAGIERDETDTEALARIIEALLQSPHFLYRIELGTPTATDGVFALTDFEIAARLSFLAWRTGPDHQLLSDAAAGVLRTPSGRAEALDRLLDDQRAAKAWWTFFAQWLHFDDLLRTEKDRQIHPNFGVQKAVLYEEARVFTELNGFAANGSIERLLSHPFQLDHDPRHAQRRGALSLPAWLAVNAKPSMTSPIHRGVFVREQLLCTTLPPPPPEAMVTAPDPDPSLSAREQYEIHRADEACNSCHQLIDPVGLVFENFDEVGLWRDRDNGRPVDTSGEMFGSRDLDGVYESHVDLLEGLARSAQVHRCFNHQVFRFILGRGERASDACWLEGGYEAYESNGRSLRALLRYYVESPAFTRITREVNDGP